MTGGHIEADELCAAISQLVGRPIELVSPQSTLRDMGLDSVEMLQVAVWLSGLGLSIGYDALIQGMPFLELLGRVALAVAGTDARADALLEDPEEIG